MAEAKPGLRVSDRDGMRGTIQSVNRCTAQVKWDDGHESIVLTDTIYKIGGPRWGLYVLAALSLGLIITLSVWLR